MNRFLTFTQVILIICISHNMQSIAQVVPVPVFPGTDDDVTIIFDASKGNGALSGYSGNVYMHTGVITTESINGSDWKHIVGNWGVHDSNVLMENLGNNLYRKSYNIRTFYGILQEEQALQLAFVFRNTDGSIVGRATDGSDIYISVNAYLFKNYISHSLTGSELTIVLQNGAMTIEAITESIAKISLYPDGNISPDTTYSVILTSSVPSPSISDNTAYLDFSCGELTVRINKSPVRLSFRHNGNVVSSEEVGYFSDYSTKGLRFRLSEQEAIYGTGSRAIPINQRGQRVYSYNEAHYSYSNGASTLNINIPFIISTNMYGIYIENRTAAFFDIGYSCDSVFQYTVEDGKLSYYIISGSSFYEILDGYTGLTGKQPLPPRWALGYLQSRFGYQDEQEARDMVTQLQQQDFQLDALILDVYWFGQLQDMGNFTWNTSAWSDPVGMIDDFKALGVKTILISEPYITMNSFNYSYADANLLFGTDYSGCCTYIVPDFFAGQAGLLDIFKPATKNWMWDKYKQRINDGIAGWWCDVGEPENHPSGMLHVTGTARQIHNVYALEWAKLIYDGYKQYFPEQRLFNLTRSGFAGIQRYSTFIWSGDVNRSFEALQAQIPIMLGMSMSGAAYMHSDIGGFAGGSYNPELYTRWMQFGAFTPVMRPHGEGIASEPIYYPDNEKNIIREYIKLRYKLLPYNYSLAWQNSETGVPLTLPVNYFEPENTALENINDEYLWGENILVAPVLSAGQQNRTVAFPSGKWIDYWTNQIYNGNSSASVNAPLDILPLFIKAGSFIPMTTDIANTEEYNTDTLLVLYYPDISNSYTGFTMYDDDGKTPEANLNGQYEIIRFDGQFLQHQTNIFLSKTGNGYTGMPETREMLFQIQRFNSMPYKIFIGNDSIPVTASLSSFYNDDTAGFWDDQEHVLHIHFKWEGSNETILIAHDEFYNGTDEPKQNTNSAFYLQNPYPNPFTDALSINYNIFEKGDYSINIYNTTGEIVRKFPINNMKTGSYSITWDGKNFHGTILPSGLYLITLKGNGCCQKYKVIKQ
ncbi:MAG: DUF4968 domain-containing protein [Bacteroidia bacterium]|nr:DUF4968 domain-containing protein [Bacteroidia bacterium]